jgi:hypothetical protein
MHDFPNAMPALPRRMDEETIARLRAAEGQIDDEHDAARDYESEDGRDGAEFGPFSCRLMYVCMLIVAGIGAAVLWWPR